MGLTVEEIKLKLGMDDKELDEGTRRALAKVAGMGKETHKAFYEHGEKPARAFHRVIHELSDQFPLLGGAARIALSPIGGTMAVVATAFTYATDKLKEWNREMDVAEKKNAQPITRAETALARFYRHQDAAWEKADFERDQREKNSPIEGVGRNALTRRAQSIEKELNVARAAANSDKVKAGQDAAAGTIESLKAAIAEAQAVPKPGWASTDPTEKYYGERYEDAQKSLKLYTEQLKHAEENLAMLNRAEADNKRLVDEKKKDLERVIAAIKTAPSDSAMPRPILDMLEPDSQLDPNTGGIAYRPLADRGGIAYRPLGARTLDASPPSSVAGHNQQISTKLDTIIEFLKDGLPVYGKEK